jgi:hypothetical protein
MNEFSTLRTLREEVPTPTADQLAPAFARLEIAMNQHGIRVHVPRSRWVLATAAGAVLLSAVAGNVTLTARSAAAASVLRAAADGVQVADAALAPGQYLLSHTHANWMVSGTDLNGNEISGHNEQIIDVYVPSDPSAEWVLYRDWGNLAANGGDNTEMMTAQGGEFYGDPWLPQDLDAIPTTGAAALVYFDAQYSGGSASRDEDNFVRIVGLLRTGLVPAEVRAALFDALALIPGVTSTANVENFDGTPGVAIGRTELLRAGMRQEIIIDPDSGLVIGERTVSTFALFGFGLNEVVSLTAIDTSVTDTAPTT